MWCCHTVKKKAGALQGHSQQHMFQGVHSLGWTQLFGREAAGPYPALPCSESYSPSYFAFLHEEAGSGSSDLKHMYKKNWSFLFCFLFFSPVDQCICGQGFGGGRVRTVYRHTPVLYGLQITFPDLKWKNTARNSI